MGLGEEEHQGKAPFSSFHIKGTCYQCDVTLMMQTLIIWPMNVVFDRFLYCKVMFPLPTLSAAHNQGVGS